MSKELSQDYIDELIASMRDGSAEPAQSEPTPAQLPSGTAHARLFERTKRFSRQVLVLCEALHKQYAQEVAFYLSTLAGGRVNMSVMRIEELAPQEFNQFLESSSEQTVIAVFEFKDSPGLGVLQLETTIALSIYERMCGGVLGGSEEGRKLTEIEFAVMRHVIEHLITGLYPPTWEAVGDIHVILQRIQTGREATLNLMDPWAVILVTMELHVGGDSGLVYMSLPYAMLEPFLDSMEARQPITGSSKAIQEKYQGILRAALRTVDLPVEVVLGKVRMSLEAFAALQAGDVVVFEDAHGVELPVLVGGRPKYLGRPGRIGSYAAVQISRTLQKGADE